MLEPTAASPFRTTGDSSPVIFGPAAGRAVAVYKPRQGGSIPTVPAALAAAGFTSGFRKRILLSSLYFCHRNLPRFARTNFPQTVIARMPEGIRGNPVEAWNAVAESRRQADEIATLRSQ